MKTRIARPFAVVAFACVMAVVSIAEGAPVVYDESVSGDVDGHSFVFDIGTNTISGSYIQGCLGSGCDFPELQDPDQFGFTLPAGTRLVELTAHFACCFGSFSLDGPAVSVTFDFPPHDYGGPFDASIPTDHPLPWESGSYRGQNVSCFSPHSEGAEGVFQCSYQFNFTVAPVPEPSASFLVLGTGIAGLGSVAWWERRATPHAPRDRRLSRSGTAGPRSSS